MAPIARTIARRRVALVSAAALVVVTAGSIPALVGQTAPERPFCPKRQSTQISAEGHTLRMWLRRETRSTLVNLCWVGSPTQEVTNWTGTAVDTSRDGSLVTFSVLALTARTALGYANLPPGRTWRVTFQFDSPIGERPSMSTVVRT